MSGHDAPILGRVPHVVVDDLDALELADDDRRHLAKSLRVRDGDDLTATDGRGRWRHVRFGDPLIAAGPVVEVERRTPEITVAFSRTKGDRPDLVVQKLTELGVDRIVVFESDHSVARWDPERRPRQVERLVRVAREATMQSRRCLLPEIRALDDFAAAAALPGARLASDDGEPPDLSGATWLIGPEGGWSSGERASDLRRVRLGDHVLRAETAAITAGVLLTTMRADLVRSVAQTLRKGETSHAE